MTILKLAITLPQELLKRVDSKAKQYHIARSKFIAKMLNTNLNIMDEAEVAASYDAVFQDKDIQAQQVAWSNELFQTQSSKILDKWK